MNDAFAAIVTNPLAKGTDGPAIAWMAGRNMMGPEKFELTLRAETGLPGDGVARISKLATAGLSSRQ